VRRVTFTSTASRQLAKLDRTQAKRIMGKLDRYAADPASLANQVKALSGSEALRLRVGDYRVIFTDSGLVLLILKVGHRREVYD
jgi:mRNA interferase RelE/StbE